MSDERLLEGTSIDRVAVSRTSRSRGLVENFGHIASRLQYHERATGTTTSDPSTRILTSGDSSPRYASNHYDNAPSRYSWQSR